MITIFPQNSPDPDQHCGNNSSFLLVQPRPIPAKSGVPGRGQSVGAVPGSGRACLAVWREAHEDPALTHRELAEPGAGVGVREGLWL